MAMCKTEAEAARVWVSSFSKYPRNMIGALMKMDPTSWKEITAPVAGDRVRITPKGYGERDGEIALVKEGTEEYLIRLDNGKHIEVEREDFVVIRNPPLPDWEWMWAFGDSADDYWLSSMGGIQKMSLCGFRVYEHNEWGCFFGIDRDERDFYESHWIPLYRLRNLAQCKPKEEEEGANKCG